MGWMFRISFAFTCAAVFQGLIIAFTSVCLPFMELNPWQLGITSGILQGSSPAVSLKGLFSST